MKLSNATMPSQSTAAPAQNASLAQSEAQRESTAVRFATTNSAQKACMDKLESDNKKWWAEYKQKCQAGGAQQQQQENDTAQLRGSSALHTTVQTTTTSSLQTAHSATGLPAVTGQSEGVTHDTVTTQG